MDELSSKVPLATKAALWLATLASRTIRLDGGNPNGWMRELYFSTIGWRRI
jgi:hypothetical protein